ncbi:MAG: hypothetical protein QNK23_07600 [Crocinitomicaceae bacterium]|nr:hypothetical protein [Crocinitomicaceae bacterium]
MTKKQIRKRAYQGIYKEGRTHQEVFDEIRSEYGKDLEATAEIVSKVPSRQKQESLKIWRVVFIAVLAILIILRSLGVWALMESGGAQRSVFIIALFFGLIVPVLGIIAALTARAEFYYTVGALLTLSILRSFGQRDIQFEPIVLIAMTPVVISIILAFVLPIKLKTKYTLRIVKEEVNNKIVSRSECIFEDFTSPGSEDVLDTNLG